MLRSRLARLFLVAVLVGAAAGAAAVGREAHRQIDAIAADGRAAMEGLARLELLTAELRNAVSGSEETVPSSASLTRAAGLVQRLRSETAELARVPARAGIAGVAQAGDAVGTALERATTYLDEGADLMAGDVLANDAARGVTALSEAVRQARTQQAQTATLAAAPLVERVTLLAGGAAALVVLGLVVLAVTSARPRDVTERPEQRSGQGLEAPVEGEPRVTPTGDTTNLGPLADLCDDVAAAASPSDLPALLERTAALVGAHGVILWAASDGHLVPVAAHGYTSSALRAMGRVSMSAGTPLADACHSFRASAVPAGDGAPAALVVPLGTTGACHGILTAECRHADGFRQDALAVARIAGSQFAAEFLGAGHASARQGRSDLPLDAASA